MTDPNGPAEERGLAIDPAQLEPPGGCACGVTGCLTVAVVISAVLIAIVVMMAIMRPEVGPQPLPPPR